MNENKRIDNPQIKIVKCVGAKVQDEKCIKTLQKQTMGVIFNMQNSQVLNWPLSTEEIFQVNDQNRPVANLPVVDFRSQTREISAITKATEYRTFGFSFRILVFFPFEES